jgi:hypothetical protein
MIISRDSRLEACKVYSVCQNLLHSFKEILWKYRKMQWHETMSKLSTGVQYELHQLPYTYPNNSVNHPIFTRAHLSSHCFLLLQCCKITRYHTYGITMTVPWFLNKMAHHHISIQRPVSISIVLTAGSNTQVSVMYWLLVATQKYQ